MAKPVQDLIFLIFPGDSTMINDLPLLSSIMLFLLSSLICVEVDVN